MCIRDRAHRSHASTAGVAKYLPQAAMGLLMERELRYLKDELANPDRPARLRPFSGTAQLGFLKFQISQPAPESSPKLSQRQVRKPSLEEGIR